MHHPIQGMSNCNVPKSRSPFVCSTTLESRKQPKVNRVPLERRSKHHRNISTLTLHPREPPRDIRAPLAAPSPAIK